MTAVTPLDRLAAAHHIEPGYDDIWQRRHETSDETKRALLRAMDVAADDDRAVEASLQAFEDERASHLAPGIVVRCAGERITLPLTTEAEGGSRYVWNFSTEDGVEQAGEGCLDDLAVIGRVDAGGAIKLRYALTLPIRPELGYHRCALTLDDNAHVETDIVVTPRRAFLPERLANDGSLTGVTAPLYGLRSGRNAGIGDFADLADLAMAAAPMGAEFIGINPTHALFPSQPARISPYAPSSRHFLNILPIALDQVPEFDASPAARSMLEKYDVERLRASDLVAYRDVSALKMTVLEALFETFADLPDDAPRKVAFRAFCEAAGPSLCDHARFEALAEWMLSNDPTASDWRNWPTGYRTADAPDVQAFADAHADRIAFHAYLQWLARDQLAEAQRRAIEAGMALGLYRDLAVGVAPDGAEAWGGQGLLVDGVRIGAPADDFNPNGQNWGLLPLSPTALQARRYRPFIELIRRNMDAAGALRIDHVLGLARSFWLPEDDGAPGAYIRYPLEDLLGLIALESLRNRCLVIGEDLGTVPDRLRAALDERGLLGCRLLYFERDEDDACRPASAYPRNCVASIGTHDLPTLRGFWEGRDIAWREKLGLYPDQECGLAERRERDGLKTKLLTGLLAENLLPEDIDPEEPPAVLSNDLILAFHRFLGMTPAMLKVVQLEDIFDAREQANLPGTVDEHPNWRRKVGPPLEELVSVGRLSAMLTTVAGRDDRRM